MINPENSLPVPLGSMHFEPLVAVARVPRGPLAPPLRLFVSGTRGLQVAFDTGTAHPIQAAELRPPWPPDPQLRVLQGSSHVFIAPCAPPSIEV